MKKKAGNLVICIIFLAGLSLLLYPFVANQWNNYRQKQLISGYEQVVSEKEAAEGIDYDAERKKAEDYNEALLPCVLPDSFALAESSGVDIVCKEACDGIFFILSFFFKSGCYIFILFIFALNWSYNKLCIIWKNTF